MDDLDAGSRCCLPLIGEIHFREICMIFDMSDETHVGDDRWGTGSADVRNMILSIINYSVPPADQTFFGVGSSDSLKVQDSFYYVGLEA